MPNFFILGAPKTGTTAMGEYLAEHPQVFMCGPKEPHHFNSDHTHGSFKDPGAYAALFEAADERHRCVGEASVWYLYSDVAVPRIEAELPGAKYIVMLRNPITMAASLHEQQIFTGHENRTTFEAAWRAQAARRHGRDIPTLSSDPKLLLYEEACSLGTQLARLYERVPRPRVLCLFHEDFRADPRQVWRHVQDFLGLDDDGRTEFPVVNAAKGRKSLFLTHCNNAYVALRTRFNLLPLGTGIFTRINRWNLRPRPRAALSPAIRAELEDAFSAEIALLENLTGRDLGNWKVTASFRTS